MAGSVLQFYDDLAEDYDLIFADWKASVLRQGRILDRFIRERMQGKPVSILDCTCGIGTQAIGLALHGHTVYGTDLSPAAIARAEREAKSLGASLTLDVADVRQLQTRVSDSFDVVLSCDNSLPHLLTDEDLLLAARKMRSRLRAGGLLLIAIRDYDGLIKERPRFMPTGVYDDHTGRRIVFQVWDWRDGEIYTVHHFIVRQTGKDWRVAHRVTEYRALLRDELTTIVRRAGFAEVGWHVPDDTDYVLPILTARNP